VLNTFWLDKAPMGYARKQLICLQDTPYYHCVARRVRRAWLWGMDEYAGKDYSHRKQWVLDRLRQLTEVFAIEVCAYAVMSNHYHLVLFVNQKQAREWTEAEVVERWSRLFRLPPLVMRFKEEIATRAEREAARELIESWRSRLYEISWFMKCMNEYLARRANAEEECTGRFWEGRFRSQALLDEAGLLTAMAYVDLNPVRAGVAATPEASVHTSIYERIRELRSRVTSKPGRVPLKSFIAGSHRAQHELPFLFLDYLALVDWSARAVRPDRPGSIDPALPPLLVRLNIDAAGWCSALRPHGNVFGRALGRLNHLRLHAATLGQSCVRGLREAERLYGH
jgi:REP element-mobilizing transposase RayT